MTTARELKQLLYDIAPKNFTPLFFKTGPGEYAEYDKFLSINTPTLKQLAQKAKDLPLSEISLLLESPFNEERQLALFILIKQYQKSHNKEEIYQFLLNNIQCINNWNLVDTVAPAIIGDYLFTQDKHILLTFAHSKNLWERRIAIVSTYYFIKQNQYDYTLQIAEILLNDPHDLIHKAVGWMLREVGKRNEATLRTFLDQYSSKMPRTMLRYAIERLPNETRLYYLKKT